MDDEKVVETPETEKPVDNTPDPLAEFKDSDGNFVADKIQKLADDKKYLRQQISKLKQLPSSVEEYGKNFVLDSKFDEFVSDEANKKKIDSVFEKLDKLSLEKGLSVERNNDIRRFVLDELVESKAIDLTPAAKKEEMAQKIVAERNEAVQKEIGEVSDIKNWDSQLYDWLHTFCNSQVEYDAHKKLAETNSLWALSLDKIRKAQMGLRIPVVNSDPTYSPEEWQRQFAKADRETQDKMLTERAKKLTEGKK
jgi:hypothetical protein